MNNLEKFMAMSYDHLPRNKKYRCVINELDLLDESKVHMIKKLVNPFGTTTAKSFHNMNTCLAVQEIFDFLGSEIEIHYLNCSWKDAIKYAKEMSIRTIGRSATFWALGQEDQDAIDDFNAFGGIFVCSAGNDRSRDNSPTTVSKDFISVGCVYEPDNSNSTVVVYSSLSLPSYTDGVSNIYTDTSGAQPQVLAVATIMATDYGMNKDRFEKWLIANGKTDIPNLEKGERLLYIPVLEKVELCRFTIGSNIAVVKGQEIKLDQEPEIDEDTDRTLMPIRAVLEALGFTVKWDPETQSISVY